MTPSCSDDLLSKLVENIRQACEQHITFERFTSVSGLICFDIDGFKQQCFVISELVQRKSVGEGHSSHLKTLNWKGIEKTESEEHAPKESSYKTQHTDESNCYRPLDAQTELQNGDTGLKGSFAILQNKVDWCNRTFTLKPKEPYEIKPSSNNSPQKKHIPTAIISKECALKVNQELAQSRQKNEAAREINIYEKNWPKRCNISKANPLYRNCYPVLPKKPVRRSKPFNNASKWEKQAPEPSNCRNSEPINDINQSENVNSVKSLYNSPSEKPTALSWFETMVSPSSSIESIDSIQPFYLVPHSDPLSNPLYYKNETKTRKELSSHSHGPNAVLNSQYNGFTEPTLKISAMTPVRFTTERKQAQHHTASRVDQESPPKTIAAHSTTSNGTLNTITSIEPDVIAGKESDYLKSTWEAKDNALKASLLHGTNFESQIPSECSIVSKKRASLRKWMGLFRKGSKTSANEVSVVQKHETKLKSGRNIPEPPIEIRLKKWK